MAIGLRKKTEFEADLFTIQKTWWAKLFMRSKKGEMEIKHYEFGEKKWKSICVVSKFRTVTECR